MANRAFPIIILSLFLLGTIQFKNDLCAQNTIDETIPIEFSIGANGINRALASQINSMNTLIDGNYQGVEYSINLNRPHVDISSSVFTITLTVDYFAQAGSTVLIDDKLSFEVEAGVRNINLDIEKVLIDYTNLRQAIDQIASITDDRLKDILDDELSEIDWIIFEGLPFGQNEIRWTETADIRWTNIGDINTVFSEGRITLQLNPVLESTKPMYRQAIYKYDNDLWIEVWSNNRIYFSSLIIYKNGLNNSRLYTDVDIDNNDIYSIYQPDNYFAYRTLYKIDNSNFTHFFVYIEMERQNYKFVGKTTSYGNLINIPGESEIPPKLSSAFHFDAFINSDN